MKEAVLPDAFSCCNQDIPYGMSDNSLEARFKRLILETRAYYPSAYSEAFTKGENLNSLSPR